MRRVYVVTSSPAVELMLVLRVQLTWAAAPGWSRSPASAGSAKDFDAAGASPCSSGTDLLLTATAGTVLPKGLISVREPRTVEGCRKAILDGMGEDATLGTGQRVALVFGEDGTPGRLDPGVDPPVSPSTVPGQTPTFMSWLEMALREGHDHPLVADCSTHYQEVDG